MAVGGGIKVNNISINGGANGKTPIFAFGEDISRTAGHLYNSYDNGVTWNDLGQVKGENGTIVIANPSGTALQNLTKIKIGDTIYNIVGGGGSAVSSVNGKTGAVIIDKNDIGLGNVVNTGDSDTPVANGTTKFTTGGAYAEINKLTASISNKLDKKTANDEVFEYAYVFYKRNNVDYQGYKYICQGDNKLINAIAKYDENTNLGSGEPVKNSDCATKGYVDYTIDSDLSSTTATINNAIKQTRYVRGTLTELSFTFKMNDDIGTYVLKDGDQIVIEFISGSTATTVTRDTTNAIYNFSTVGANKFVEINAEYKASIGKWVVLSAETPYTAS